MAKTATAIRSNDVPPYKKFRMDLKLRKIKKNYNMMPRSNEILHIPSYRIPSKLNSTHLNAPHHRPTTPLPTPAVTATTILNPFNDPPSNCNESDVRWVWRMELEKRRGHSKNKQYYSHYAGSKKSRKHHETQHVQHSSANYCGNHHVKHLVKIGCPKHDLSAVLNDIGYNNVDDNATICTHKSHLCPVDKMEKNVRSRRHFIGSVSMRDIGLEFKRNAFSTDPLNIELVAGNGNSLFAADIYVKRIANTNFSKSFRPGSYGKLQSLKKGSWKEGKIFYVFENDELILNITDHLWIAFDLKSSASDGNNEENTIDGWKNIVGGVGLWSPPDHTSIASVLVLRKSINFPLECLQKSTITVYSSMFMPELQQQNDVTLYIGTKAFAVNNPSVPRQLQHVSPSLSRSSSSTTSTVAISHELPHAPQQHMHAHALTNPPTAYDNLLRYCHELRSANMSLMESNNNLQQEKQNLSGQVQQLNGYVNAQNEQIAKLHNDISNYSRMQLQAPCAPPTHTHTPLYSANCACCRFNNNDAQSVAYSTITPMYL